MVEFKGDVSIKKALKLIDGNYYAGFRAPTLGADVFWYLPAIDGNVNQLLKTDGAGNLGWVTNSATDELVGVDVSAIPGYIGAARNDGILRTGLALSYTDGGDFVTLDVATDGINDTHIDWGTGANQVSALDIPITDFADDFVATEVESAFAELFTGPKTFLVTPSSAPSLDYEVANKKYVDDSASGGGYWDRTGTDLSPLTAGDDLLFDSGEQINWDINDGAGTAWTVDQDFIDSASTTMSDIINSNVVITTSTNNNTTTGIFNNFDFNFDYSGLGGGGRATLNYDYNNLTFDVTPAALLAVGGTVNVNKITNAMKSIGEWGGDFVFAHYINDTGIPSDVFKVTDMAITNSVATTIANTFTASSTATFNGTTQHNNILTVGVNDTGYDVKFFGATSGRYMLWDESADKLALTAGCVLSINGDDLTENIIENLRENGKITLRPESDIVADYTSSFAESTANDGILDSAVESSVGPKPYMLWRAVTGISALQYTALVYQVQIPMDFSSWTTSNAAQIDYKTTSASSTYNRVAIDVYDTTGSKDYDGASLTSVSWTTLDLSEAQLNGTYTPGGMMYIVVRLASYSNAYYAYARKVVLNYEKDI